jgi:isopentenyl diphosphate isomerase/L-lactate dehydrogenase-like FMN-dependent dehydrogenase
MRGAAPKSASTALSYPITAGRQFDRALTAVQALPAIKRAVGDRLVIMLDGGIRRGSDIVTSLCLGTGFVFTGRALCRAQSQAAMPASVVPLQF